jgi:putative ABC transport system substrate-binding protein
VTRRDLVALAGGAVSLGSFAALAQQNPMPTVGVLVAGRPDPAVVLRSLRDGLRELGYTEGQNIRIELRSAAGDVARLPQLAAGLVRERAEIIAVWQTPAALAAKAATRDIPIVMLSVGNPVREGLVASLAHPGGNITGTAAQMTEFGGKNLELLKQLLPALRRLAVLSLAGNPFSVEFAKEISANGQLLGIETESVMTMPGPALDAAFAGLSGKGVDAAIIVPNLPMEQSAGLALRYRVPTAAPWRPFAEAGGLMAYTFNAPVMFRQAAVFIDKILKGTKPADLPVEQPTKFELVINLRTADALGLTVPPSLLARADEVIE